RPPNVAKLEAKRDVDGLIKALRCRKDGGITPSAAAEALGRLGDPRADAPASNREEVTPCRSSDRRTSTS
ncbi:MAG: hypothetical protein WB783_10075, partial [Arenicellales bacterium]